MGDGLVAQVAAGHNERTADARQEQVVDGRVGQQDPELGQTGRNPRGHRRPLPSRRDHDRPAGVDQGLHRRRAQLAESLCGLQVRHHHREGLVVAGLAAT